MGNASQGVGMPTPGIYAVNATGEMVALSLEDGSGDKQLLKEILEEQDVLQSV